MREEGERRERGGRERPQVQCGGQVGAAHSYVSAAHREKRTHVGWNPGGWYNIDSVPIRHIYTYYIIPECI